MDLTEKTTNTERHPWEIARSKFILQLLPKNLNDLAIADIGSGDMYFTSKLRALTNVDILAVDIEYSENQTANPGIICLNKLELIKNNSLDYIIMMDVLEHIPNEDEFIIEVMSKLKESGKIILTVPAMQFLFSSHDVFLKHCRRYSRKRLISVLQQNGLSIEKSFYFYTILFWARLFSLIIEKLGNKKKENHGIGLWKYSDKNSITRFIVSILMFDSALNKMLNRLHIRIHGLSVLAVCTKNN